MQPHRETALVTTRFDRAVVIALACGQVPINRGRLPLGDPSPSPRESIHGS